MKTVFVDVDTQIDFLFPAGALYVPGSESLLPRFAALNRYAASQGIALISTMDAHSENDPEFKDWPPHCVVGTTGQQKPAATLLENRVVVPSSTSDVTIAGAQQILLEKQTTNCFTNANLERVLGELGAERYVVYGVVTEICVKNAVLGLLKTGKRVELVTDAVQSLDAAKAVEVLESFTVQGGVRTTWAEVMAQAA
ncbi:MAG: isochorismatase family cysteine hydrolase [Bryobacteraceae bacterium]